MPTPTQAGFFSAILNDEAYAQTDAVVYNQNINNSQTMDLLQADVSSVSILKDEIKTKDETVDTNLDVNISENALSPEIGPTGVSDGVVSPDSSLLDQTSVYVVRKGDSLSQIASMFGVSTDTIIWANGMKKGDKLKEGDVLFILPISGIKHTVTKGQTLKGIAKLYSVTVDDIVESNDVKFDTVLAVGDMLIIPDGLKAEESDKPIKNTSASLAKDKKYYETHPLPNLAGYYVNPVPGYRKSQGVHDKNAVDFAIAKGTPIHAAAEGKVILARNGYNGGYGNLVIIAHPNGTETLYAHQSKIATKTGAQVYQGEVIGYIGSTGRSTGPHLHFEVRGARNPGADGSWKY